MKLDIWLWTNKWGQRRCGAPPFTLWLLGILLLFLLLTSASGVVFHSPKRAFASAQPAHPSMVHRPAPPTPGPAPAPPRLPENARSIAAQPPGLGTQQTQMLAELGHPNKALLVSVDNQTLYVYQGDTLLTWSYVTTGRPELQTPRGFYSVLQR